MLREALGALLTPWNEWRTTFAGTPIPAIISPDPVCEAILLRICGGPCRA